MKILIIKEVYSDYEKSFYSKYNVKEKSYNEQKNKYYNDFFAWPDSWVKAFKEQGYMVEDIVFNMEHLQKTWAEENLPNHKEYSIIDITLQQIKTINPDIIWCFPKNYELLYKIRNQCKDIKLLMGWVGSAVPENIETLFKFMDVVFTCAPENVAKYKNFPIEHIHNAFDERINNFINKRNDFWNMIFIGSIVRGSQYHNERERLLLDLCNRIDLKIYTPSFYTGYSDILYSLLKQSIYKFNRIGIKLGMENLIKNVPVFKRALKWNECPQIPVNLSLKSKLRKPVFGLEMFQTIADATLVLNIHADSSPLYASNMRLFEITGVGSCMITDWKSNITDLFIPDEEVIVYNSNEECLEKIEWLNSHQDIAHQIALAGQRRCLAEHTFKRRVNNVEKVIKKYLK